MATEEERRAAAEARRQKILARGKDRLTQITTGVPAPSPAADSAPAPSASAQEGEADMAAVSRPAAAEASAPTTLPPSQPVQPPASQPPTPPPPVQPAHVDMQQEAVGLRQRVRTEAQGDPAQAPLSAPQQAPAWTRDAPPADQPQDAGAKASLGSVQVLALRHAVSSTAIFRCLGALGIAYALTQGQMSASQRWFPPVMQLVLLQVLLIAAAFFLNSLPSRRAVLEEKARREARLAKYKSDNLWRLVLGLFPGLGSGMSSLQAYSEAASSIGDVTAFYIVVVVVVVSVSAL